MKTLEEIKALNDQRLREGARDRAEDFEEQQRIDDNNWNVYLNEFVRLHTGGSAIERGTLFECKESNTNVLLLIAKEMNLRPSLAALEEAWAQGIRTGKLLSVPELPSDEKAIIIKKFLIEKYRLGPRTQSSAMTGESEREPLDKTLSQLKFSEQEWQAAWASAEVACAEAFKRAQASKHVKPITGGSKVVPQIFKPEFPEVTLIPECVRYLTFKDVMTMKSAEQLRIMKVPGAKQHLQRIIDNHRKGSK